MTLPAKDYLSQNLGVYRCDDSQLNHRMRLRTQIKMVQHVAKSALTPNLWGMKVERGVCSLQFDSRHKYKDTNKSLDSQEDDGMEGPWIRDHE